MRPKLKPRSHCLRAKRAQIHVEMSVAVVASAMSASIAVTVATVVVAVTIVVAVMSVVAIMAVPAIVTITAILVTMWRWWRTMELWRRIAQEIHVLATGTVASAMLAPVLGVSWRNVHVDRRRRHHHARRRNDHGLLVDQRRWRRTADVHAAVDARGDLAAHRAADGNLRAGCHAECREQQAHEACAYLSAKRLARGYVIRHGSLVVLLHETSRCSSGRAVIVIACNACRLSVHYPCCAKALYGKHPLQP